MASKDLSRRPSEFNPFPGAAALRDGPAPKAGQDVPPIARPHNGWERRTSRS